LKTTFQILTQFYTVMDASWVYNLKVATFDLSTFDLDS